MYRGSHRINLFPDRLIRDRKGNKVKINIPLILDESDRNRVQEWLLKTRSSIIQYQNKSTKMKDEERIAVNEQKSCIEIMLQVFCKYQFEEKEESII